MSRVIGEVSAPRHHSGCSNKGSHKNSNKRSSRSNKGSWDS
jgi:hypothetical protein